MAAHRRPNVLVYVSHDTGRHISPYGVETVRTPNAERLAADGVVFENCFCTAPQCSPSRASLFTGRYPHANGVMGLTHARFGWDLGAGETHLAAHLKALGYDTCMVGTHHEMRRFEERGFDFQSGELHCLRQAGVLAEWLDGRADASRPFYAQLAPYQTHRPFPREDCPADDSLGVTVPGYLDDTPGTRADFAALQGIVRQWDEGLGRLLDLLDSRRLAEQTLLIVTTDHGIAFPRAKCTLYDPGIGVLMMVRHAGGGIGGGRRAPQLISNVDVTPTVLELLAAEAPAGIQGRSFAPLLLKSHDAPPRETVFAEQTFHGYYRPMRAVRTARWKYIRNFEMSYGVKVPTDAQQSDSFRDNLDRIRAQAHTPYDELYDLAADPWEQANLAEQAEHAATRAELSAALAAWMRETNDPLLDGPVASPFYREAIERLGR
jgi:arylsulfatase A-like enzyme